ncbi:hypothetical protein [Undibacterium sp. Ren11W]|uniref:hypothetical protein n=1 Tax=Undibacterium sp. Ren11W TaxID=3413045 RepID=UPI003BF3EC79
MKLSTLTGQLSIVGVSMAQTIRPTFRGIRKLRAAAVSLLCLLPLLTACGTTQKKLSAVVFNYWPRPILDVSINGHWAGLAPAAENGRVGGGGGMVSGVPVSLGLQKIEWVLDGGKNAPRLGEKISTTANLQALPSDARVLAIHIYPDNTVFIEVTSYIPEARPEGIQK